MTRKLLAAAKWLPLLLVGTASASADNIDLFEQERAEIGNATEVYYPSESMANKALITFHNQLLESRKDKGYLVLQLSQRDKATLKSLGFELKPAQRWIASRNRQIDALEAAELQPTGSASASVDTIPGYPCYSTVEGTYAEAKRLSELYPKLAKWVDIGDSWTKLNSEDGQNAQAGGYDLNVLQITNSENTADKPILFIHAAMHAREYTTAELALRFAKKLIEGYGKNADATWILDNHQVHILFHMNPDGRKKAEAGLLWRKNVNTDYCGVNSNSRGADLNRNFSFFWNASGGSSGDQCSEIYRGPTPASEPETQAVEAYIRSIYADRRGPNDDDAAPLDTSGIHIDIHSFSELVLWPWGHKSTPAPNDAQLATLGRKFAYFNGYTAQQSIGLYPTDGTSDDVSYGELGVAAYTFELGTRFFQSCSMFESTILPDNLKALMYAAKVVGMPYVLPKGPDAVDVTLDGQSRVNVQAGAVVTLQAKIDDGRFHDGNGSEPRQKIAAAEFYVGQAPTQADATAQPMNAVDGSFDSQSEQLQASIDTTGMADGKYLVYVRGKDSDGNWGAVSAAYLLIGQVNEAPVAGYQHQCTGLNCNFDAGLSIDSDGLIIHYRWDLGDGAVVVGEDKSTIEHLYTQSGTYQVSLTVTDELGASGNYVSTVEVANLAPVADFVVGCSNNVCQFDASASVDQDGSIVSYVWSFGDGNSAEGAVVSHTYNTAGNFDVKLTVTDNFDTGTEKSTSVTVSLPAAPQAQNSSNGSSGGGGSLGFAGLLLLLPGLFRGRLSVK